MKGIYPRPAKASRPAARATALRWARLARSLRRVGTDIAAVTAGMRGKSSGNCSKSATATAKAMSQFIETPLSWQRSTCLRQSPARAFSSKSMAEPPWSALTGRPPGAALESPLGSVKVLKGGAGRSSRLDERDVAAIAYRPPRFGVPNSKSTSERVIWPCSISLSTASCEVAMSSRSRR
jgi:hypothetical protein